MADRTFYINNETGNRVDSNGAQDTSLVQLDYKALEDWTYTAVDSNNDVIDLSTATTWRFALDDNLNYSSTPWIRILDNDIDSTDASNGVIVMSMDSNTEPFRMGVNGLRFKQTYSKLQGFDASGYEKFAFCIPVLAMGNVDPTGGTPADADEYYDKDEADARFAHIDASATEDNFASFDADGDIQDSGVSAIDISDNTTAIDDHIADTANPHQTDIGNLGSGTLAELNSAITDATLGAEEVGTEQSCANNVTTYIDALDKTKYRSGTLNFTLDDGTNYIKYSYSIAYDGADAVDDGGEIIVIHGAQISGVSVGFDVSGDYVRLAITLTSVGNSIQCVYSVTDKLILST